jgi:hypothetical protein
MCNVHACCQAFARRATLPCLLLNTAVAAARRLWQSLTSCPYHAFGGRHAYRMCTRSRPLCPNGSGVARRALYVCRRSRGAGGLGDAGAAERGGALPPAAPGGALYPAAEWCWARLVGALKGRQLSCPRLALAAPHGQVVGVVPGRFREACSDLLPSYLAPAPAILAAHEARVHGSRGCFRQGGGLGTPGLLADCWLATARAPACVRVRVRPLQSGQVLIQEGRHSEAQELMQAALDVCGKRQGAALHCRRRIRAPTTQCWRAWGPIRVGLPALTLVRGSCLGLCLRRRGAHGLCMAWGSNASRINCPLPGCISRVGCPSQRQAAATVATSSGAAKAAAELKGRRPQLLLPALSPLPPRPASGAGGPTAGSGTRCGSCCSKRRWRSATSRRHSARSSAPARAGPTRQSSGTPTRGEQGRLKHAS